MINSSEIFNQQLLVSSRLAELTLPTLRFMLQNNFRLLSSDFGGLIQNYDSSLSAEIELFEIERIKEKILRRSLPVISEDKIIGYREGIFKSKYIEEILKKSGLNHSDLQDFNRPNCLEKIVSQQPWGLRYSSRFIKQARGGVSRLQVENEIKKEMEVFNLEAIELDEIIKHASLKKYILNYFHHLFVEFGFKKVKSIYRKKNTIYSNFQSIKSGIPLQFSFDVNCTGIESPYVISVEFMTLLDWPNHDSDLINVVRAGGYFSPIKSTVPNFGFYQTGNGLYDLPLMLHAHKILLTYWIPNAEIILENQKSLK